LVQTKLIHFFETGIERGDLVIDDLTLAADQFSELCKADLFPRLVFSMEKSFDDVQKLRIVTGAVDTFLARYAA
jgi:TetR/AcrR family transcriptional repressor of mexJK operon